MKTKNLETIFSTACFALLNVLFLFCHFSAWAALSVALTILFYILKINVIGRKRAERGISEWIGTYLGAFFIDVIVILALENKIYEQLPPIGLIPEGVLGTTLGALAFVIFLLGIFSKAGRTYKKPQFYIKNILLFAAFVGFSYIYINWESLAIVSFAAIIVLTGIVIDSVNRKSDSSTGGFIAACMIMLIFNLLCIFYSDFAISLVDRVYNYTALGAAPWYFYIIICVLFGICAVHAQLLNVSGNNLAIDVRVYISLIATTLMMWVFSSISTEYDMIFILVYAAVNIIFLLPQHKERNVSVAGITFSSIAFKYVVFLVLSLLLPVAFYYGWVLQHIVVFVAAIGINAFYAAYAHKKASLSVVAPHKSWSFWQFLMTIMLVFSCVCAYLKSNFIANYVVLIVGYAIATFACIILNVKNKLYPKNHYIMRGIVVVFVMLFMFFAVDQAKIQFNLKVDNNLSKAYQLSGETVGETNIITIDVKSSKTKITGYYYWANSEENIAKLFAQKDVADAVPFRNGCLCIVVEDENGVTATQQRWFYDKALAVKKPVGTANIDVSPERVEGELLPDGTSTETGTDGLTGTPAITATPVK